jgi:hypothetical protein
MSVESERRRLRAKLANTSDLPVSNFREAAPWLRRPFTPSAVTFRVLECWGGDRALTHASCVAYIDSRLVVERLNLVCPDLWSEDFAMEGGHLWCSITMRDPAVTVKDTHGVRVIDEREITRRDIGDTYPGKGLVSDARKRAAVQFGVGVSLYAVPKVLLTRSREVAEQDCDDLLRPWTEDGKPLLKLTLAGERYCRDRYRRWLLQTGIPAFGEPIDHGDVADCPSMVEIESPPPSATKARSQRARQGKQQPPEPVGAEVAEDALTALLATPDNLRGERVACDAAMAAMGLTPAHRLDELRSAKDKRGLEALLTRLANVPSQDVREDPAIENQGDTT